MQTGIAVTALHNHLIGETPRIMFLHIAGTGNAVKIASGVKSALALTSTPILDTRPQFPTLGDWTTLEAIIGHKGQKRGKVLNLSIPLKKPVFEHGIRIPETMGLSHVINIQAQGQLVAATGDFVLLDHQVNPVVNVLTYNRIVVTAVHNHMLWESPRLFFLHFWALDETNKVATVLRQVLEQIQR